MSTPTPRTSSAIIASGFQAVPEGFRAFAGILERELTALTAERDKLRAQNDQFSDNLSAVGAVYNAEKARAERAEAEVGRLRAGIAECLHTNGHLADGEDCTLIGLKRCLRDPAAARESKGGAA